MKLLVIKINVNPQYWLKNYEALNVSLIKVNTFNSKKKLDYIQTKVEKICKCVDFKTTATIDVDSIDNSKEKKGFFLIICRWNKIYLINYQIPQNFLVFL